MLSLPTMVWVTMSEYQQIRTRFIQLLERITEQRGFKPIHGRILACLFLSDQPRTQQSIAEWTGYSISAVSRALNQLESLGSVSRYKEPGDRRYQYQIGASITYLFVGAIESWLRIVEVVRHPIQQLAQSAHHLDVSKLTSKHSREAQLLIAQLDQLDSTLEKIVPFFQALVHQLESLDESSS